MTATAAPITAPDWPSLEALENCLNHQIVKLERSLSKKRHDPIKPYLRKCLDLKRVQVAELQNLIMIATEAGY